MRQTDSYRCSTGTASLAGRGSKISGHCVTASSLASQRPDEPTRFSSARPYTDFELRFQTRIGEPDNSGVQIRSDVLDPQKWTARGPQADIGNRQSDFWGGVYAEELPGGWLLKPDASPVVKPTDWNDYVIRCAGRRVTIQVNGATTVAGEIDVLQATGLLAFQIHRSNQQPVEFRQIQIRELGGLIC